MLGHFGQNLLYNIIELPTSTVVHATCWNSLLPHVAARKECNSKLWVLMHVHEHVRMCVHVYVHTCLITCVHVYVYTCLYLCVLYVYE